MKKLLSLLCVLSLSAALLAGCSTAGMPALGNAWFEQYALRGDGARVLSGNGGFA